MAKKVCKSIILFLLFLTLLFLELWLLEKRFINKETSGVQSRFAKLEKGSVDTVFIGNSHQFCSIDPDILHEEYGMETFMLATSAQTVPMSYYAAMEAIELQHPSRIIFEVSYCANDFRTVSPEMSHYFFDGMPACEARKLALRDLIEEEEIVYYLLPLGAYHGRWKELTRDDFEDRTHSDRGGVHHEETVWNEFIPVVDRKDTFPMTEEMEKYMDLLAELCKKEGVELILYVAPFNTLYVDDLMLEDLLQRERIFNYVGEYAEKNGLIFYNLFYELDELDLDYTTDWMDRQHLNCRGQAKLTRYMAEKGYFQ